MNALKVSPIHKVVIVLVVTTMKFTIYWKKNAYIVKVAKHIVQKVEAVLR